MRRFSLAVVLLISAFSFSGCIDIALRYLVRADGSVRVAYDLVLEKSMMQMLYVAKDFPEMNSSEPPVPEPVVPPPGGWSHEDSVARHWIAAAADSAKLENSLSEIFSPKKR